MTTLTDIAKWVDTALGETVKNTRGLRCSRVFGIIEPGKGQFREMKLLDSNPDPYDMLKRPPQKDGYEALCIVMTGTMSPVDEDGDRTDEPSFVVRICAAVNDDGVAVAVRRDGSTNVEVDLFPDGGEGAFPDALRDWWDSVEYASEGSGA